VVLYRITPLDLKIGNFFKKSKYISLVNLLADAELFPEYLTDHCGSPSISRDILRWLNEPAHYEETCRKLTALRDRVPCRARATGRHSSSWSASVRRVALGPRTFNFRRPPRGRVEASSKATSPFCLAIARSSGSIIRITPLPDLHPVTHYATCADTGERVSSAIPSFRNWCAIGCEVRVVDLQPSRQVLVPIDTLCKQITYGVTSPTRRRCRAISSKPMWFIILPAWFLSGGNIATCCNRVKCDRHAAMSCLKRSGPKSLD